MIPFLSTPSARRATAYLGVNPTKERISIHALREEGDALHPYHVIHTDDFYPRPPRGGRRDTNQLYLAPVEISIHALREEGDGAGFQGIEATIQFLSTPSARRATLAGSRTTSSPIRFLSTPSARRATARRRVREGFRWISIHALREEGDHTSNAKTPIVYNFYPRPPRGGRPFRDGRPDLLRCISIHALREEGDAAAPTGCLCAKISIHALREEGDPFNYEGKLRDFLISIHALREEGDFSLSGVTFVHFDFYPRPPRGGRPVQHRSGQAAAKEISIHALREEGDQDRH